MCTVDTLLPYQLQETHGEIENPVLFPIDRRPARPQLVPLSGNELCSGGPDTLEEPDNEQKLSQDLLNIEAADLHNENAISAPTRSDISPPSSLDELDPDLSMSPAAMFLSSFSPVASKDPAVESEGDVISGWTLGPVVGHGGFSTIRRAYSYSGGVGAVKIVRHTDIRRQTDPELIRKRLSHETAIWASISHEHILPLFSDHHTPYADYFFTLYCPAGSLFDILKRDGRPALPHDDAGMMFRQVVRGLRYLHEVAGIVHRDMKLENVLVDEMGVCRIGDFGMARKIGEIDEEVDSDTREPQDELELQRVGSEHRARRQTRPHLLPRHSLGHQPRQRGASTPATTSPSAQVIFQPGSLPYATPEVLLPQTAGPLRPAPAQDIWALGVMLFLMLTGRFPFNDIYEPRLQMKILHGAFKIPSDVGRSATRVLRGCLDRSVARRWTISMVDEVAWGVGWGIENETPVPEDEDEFKFVEHQNHQAGDEGAWQHTLSEPSVDARRRRSSSRSSRSRSRAPALTSRSTSVAGSTSRSPHPHAAPSLSALAKSIFHASLPSPPLDLSAERDNAVLVSPPLDYERGRRPNKSPLLSPSRSSSPYLLPATPVDFGGDGKYFSSPVDVDDVAHLQGREDGLLFDDRRVDELRANEGKRASHDVSHTSLSRSFLFDRSVDHAESHDLLYDPVWSSSAGLRAGSMPPALISPRHHSYAAPSGPGDDSILSLRFPTSGVRPHAASAASTPRSRSAGCHRDT